MRAHALAAASSTPAPARGNDYLRCTLCAGAGTFHDAVERAQVACNVRAHRAHRSTVWRCRHCRSLHALEPIDLARWYADYPLRRARLDFFAQRLYGSRLALLDRHGIGPNDHILDYGCGNGTFVRYLQSRGRHAAGFDPYCAPWDDPGVLARRYDVVTCQDVIEHTDDPLAALDALIARVRPGGMLVVGTPDAAALDLGSPLDVVGQLHQPYHRHLIAAVQLERLLEERGLAVVAAVPRWYVDTWFPFCNSPFILRYWLATGGAVDASFERFRLALVLGSPRLLAFGLFGRWSAPRKDVVIFARRVAVLGVPREGKQKGRGGLASPAADAATSASTVCARR
jgi:2-polyprenyl-3-methyl-5-hydroxy-6-metoxy-1,4-benzoquinol methylase